MFFRHHGSNFVQINKKKLASFAKELNGYPHFLFWMTYHHLRQKKIYEGQLAQG